MYDTGTLGLIISLFLGSLVFILVAYLALYVLGIFIYSKVCKRVNLPDTLAYIPVVTGYIPALAIDEVDVFGSKFNIKLIILFQIFGVVLTTIPFVGWIFGLILIYTKYTILRAFFDKYAPISTVKCVLATFFAPYTLYLFYCFGNYKEL